MTKRLFTFTIFCCGLVLLLPDLSSAQDLHPSRRLSPLGMANTFIGDTYVKVTYSRPYKRGRENIFGTGDDFLHPYGQVWRFGANEPTEITFSDAVVINETRLEAGTYSIFVTPGEDSFHIHFNDMRGGGADQYNEANNLVSAWSSRGRTSEEVNQFTIEFEESAGHDTQMVARWLDWEISVPISVAR